jgi:IS30 family transposase
MEMKRKQLHDGTHLSLDERKIIQAGIENNSTKANIARTIGKDATTVAKEIRKHREFKPRNTSYRPVLCGKKQNCSKKSCVKKCESYEEPKCSRRDKSPGACNKCEKSKACYFDKYYYYADKADAEYRRELADCREGINLTDKERDVIGEIIAPLLKKGQSVHQIMSAHPEIKQSERTIYTYIESGLFKEFDVNNFSLKEQVNRRQSKTTKYKKRKEPANYTGRKYSDFLAFRAANPDITITEMDTVYNNPSGPYLQTFIFEKTALMVGFLHKERNNIAMSSGVDILQHRLGDDMFSKLCSVLLTDRGSEFEMWKMFELDADGNSRLNIFYCDPMQSYQKPHVENNHNYIRDIIPNSHPMGNLTQTDIDLMFSHINSTPRRALGDKSPFETFCFFYGKEAASALGVVEIKRDDVILRPSLIYANK